MNAVILIVGSALSLTAALQPTPFKFGRHSDGFLGSKFSDGEGGVIDDRMISADVSTAYITQKLDHFDDTNTNTWQQFYWMNKGYYKKGGPAFLLLGGEGPTSAAWIDPVGTNITMTWMKMAQKYGAMAFQLEHRYYGKSQPTPDMSTANLKYLNAQQALADAADFILNATSFYNLGNPRWVVFGGSYSGMLSGWFRQTYPELVVGSIASSAPVQAQVNFQEYLGVVANSIGAYSYNCLDQIYQATRHIQTMARTAFGKRFLQTKFKLCGPLDTTNVYDMANFYEMFANVYSGAVQYSKDNRLFYAEKYNVPAVCKLLENTKEMPSLMDRYAAVNDLYLSTYGIDCQDISQKNLVDYYRMDSWSTPSPANRLWFYQTCNEFGFYQGSDIGYRQPFSSLFPYYLTVQLCKEVFGSAFTESNINNSIMKTIQRWGGRKGFKATNTVLPNGNVDPWHILGVYDSPHPSSPVLLMRGTAHVADMYPASPNDPPELTNTRNVIDEHIGKWLA